MYYHHTYDEDFTIIEYVSLGLNDKKQVITPRETSPLFMKTDVTRIENELLFQPPEFSRKINIFTTLTSLC
jgi:hypothetical protein